MLMQDVNCNNLIKLSNHQIIKLLYLCASFQFSAMKDRKIYFETYGCQMNVADSEMVAAIMKSNGYETTDDIQLADVVVINTCSVRDNAERKIWNRLDFMKGLKHRNKNLKVGVIGCMAQRVGDKLFDSGAVDFVAGPDAYRHIPALVEETDLKLVADTDFDITETYAGIEPLRLDRESISGFVSITRGCNNFCSYCIVPYTRGRERSRSADDIIRESENLQANGYKELTLLGQNVNSYICGEYNFPKLIETVARRVPEMRVRFTTSHPKDISDELLEAIARNPNICNHIHLPVQSGSNIVLERMNRKYTREWYLDRIAAIRRIIPDCGLSTDIFCGFCGETEADYMQTVDLMETVRFDSAFLFKYSNRPGTFASKNLVDDVPEEEKVARLARLIEIQNRISLERNRSDIGKVFEVLVEGESKRSTDMLCGRTQQNKMVVFDRMTLKKGDYAKVKITEASSATLKGTVIQ